MALESLLASLKNGVTSVTGVHPNNRKASGCNGIATTGVTAVTPMAVRADSVTVVTLENSRALQHKPASIQACTAVTAVTPEKAKVESETQKVGAGDTVAAYPSCKTCAHVTGRGGCGNPVEAGLSDVAGVIRYHPQEGLDCPTYNQGVTA